MTYASKVECLVRGLGAENVDGDLPDNLRNISTLLSSFLLLAKSIKDIVRSDTSLGVLRIGVFAKAIGCASATTVPQGVHTLMGPALSKPREGRARARVAPTAVPTTEPTTEPIATQSSTPIIPPIGASSPESAINGVIVPEHNTEIVPQPSPMQTIPQCNLPDHLVRMTQSLLLDAVGWTTHPYSRKYDFGQTLSVDFLKGIIRGVMADEKKLLKVKPGTNIKYETLLPREYRSEYCKNGRVDGKSFTVNIVLPKINICDPSDLSPDGTGDVDFLKLEMQKPDRLKKTELVALLTLWLKCYGRDGTCGSFLRNVSRFGLTGGRCSTSRCGGPENCSNSPHALNRFYAVGNESREVVGSGEVDPFCTYLAGEAVKEDEIVIRLCHKDSASGRLNSENTLLIDEPHPCPRVWKKKNVGRSILLGELEEAIGSALVVGYPKIQSAPSGQFGNSLDSMDISNAIVVTDVDVKATAESELYPFREWYLMRNGQRRLRELHFGNGTVPKKMKEIVVESRAILWHKERIKFNSS